MEESGDGYNIRFRHVCGDFGPFLFPKASTVWTLKEKLLEEWAKGKKGQKKIRKRVVCVCVGRSFVPQRELVTPSFFFFHSLFLPNVTRACSFVLFCFFFFFFFCSNNNDYVILMLLLLLVVQWR